MTTLLIAEHDNASLKDATAKALTAAGRLGAPVHILVAGEGAKADASGEGSVEAGADGAGWSAGGAAAETSRTGVSAGDGAGSGVVLATGSGFCSGWAGVASPAIRPFNGPPGRTA